MDLKSLGSKAKEMIDKRGGTDSVEEDAGELKDIAKGEGSLSDKAKAAMEAIKDPGADDTPPAPAPPPTEAAAVPPTASPEAAVPGNAEETGDERQGHGRHGRHGGGGGGGGRRGGGGGGGRRGRRDDAGGA